MSFILTTDKITKRYREKLAVDNVSIHVERGEIYGLIGRNGAGKTTLLKMIAGLAFPTSGSFSLSGANGETEAQMRMKVGVLIEDPGLYANLSAFQNMKAKGIAYGVNNDKYYRDLLDFVGLGAVGNKPVKNFSLGMKQRLGIGLAMVNSPELLLLDEPINGIDPQGIVEIRDLIGRLSKERNISVIISSHILEEMSKLANQYGILDHGRMIDTFSHQELLRRCRERIELRTSDPVKACMVIEKMGITEFKIMDGSLIQIYERLDGSGDIVLELAKNNIKTLGIEVKNEALEDYYLSLTSERNTGKKQGEN